MPMFSIIVPVYNVKEYLDRCVQSILKQSCGDFELILVDDGSPDDCGAICDTYVANDYRVKVIHQQNMGVSAARNAGIAIAEGEYLYFVDSDDWIEQDTLKILAQEINANGPDIIIFGYNEIHIDSQEKFIMTEMTDDKPDIEIIRENFICDKWCNYPWNKCFSSKLFAGKFFPEGQVYEDLYLIPSIVYNAEKISILRDVLYNYNKKNLSSITKKTNSSKEYDFLLAVLKNYSLASSENLPYAEYCRCRVIEQAQKTLYLYLEDGLLDKEKLNFVERHCTEEIINSIGIPERQYKCYRKSAIIEFKRRNMTNYCKSLYYYLLKRTLCKLGL